MTASEKRSGGTALGPYPPGAFKAVGTHNAEVYGLLLELGDADREVLRAESVIEPQAATHGRFSFKSS